MSDYKPIFDDGGAGAPRPLRWLLAVLLLFGAGAATDRWLLPDPGPVRDATATAPAETNRADAAPSGGDVGRYPATARGAGDAAAYLEMLLADAAARPAAEARARISVLLAPDATTLADRLTGGAAGSAPAGIRLTVVVRVWTERATDPGVLPPGTRVVVQTYGVALMGAGTDGTSAGPDAGLTGGWAVHDLTVVLTGGGWRLTDLQPPVPAPPPDMRGTLRDGGTRDLQLLARVLGPDSWTPGLPA
jgi:3D (Asp-Asp-Asp) domain-containing protein